MAAATNIFIPDLRAVAIESIEEKAEGPSLRLRRPTASRRNSALLRIASLQLMREKRPLILVEAPSTRHVVRAPPPLVASTHTIDFTYANCRAVLLLADEGQDTSCLSSAEIAEATTPPIEFGTGSWTSSVLHGRRPLIATNVPPGIIVLASKIAGLAPLKSGQCDASVFFHSRLFREGSCKGPSWNPLAEHRSGPVAGTTQDTTASRTKWL